jgi:hypothetical protein
MPMTEDWRAGDPDSGPGDRYCDVEDTVYKYTVSLAIICHEQASL